MKKIMRKFTILFLLSLFLIPAGSGTCFAQDASSGTVFAFLLIQNNEWQPSVAAPFQAVAFSGNCELGLVAFGGDQNRKGAFIQDLVSGQWKTIADAPFPVSGCGGGNDFGPLVYGGANNRQVAYMRKYSENLWKTLVDAPFTINDMAGSNNFGPVIAGGPEGQNVAYMRKFSENAWSSLPNAPFPVRAIAGDNERGFFIAGGIDNRQVAILSAETPTQWKALADAPFPVVDISGSYDYGPVIIGGNDGHQTAVLTSYKDNKWSYGVPMPITANAVIGANNIGYIVAVLSGVRGGLISASSQKVRKDVLKTAVVGFSERGSLDIQDAGEIIAEWMIPALNKTGAFEVYERLSLDKLVQEHALGQSGMVSDETMAQIGKLRGVQVIITGSVIKFGDIISVTAKMIDVETAKIIDTAAIKVSNVNAVSGEIEKLAWELAKE
ncbi:hypothetical protein JXQ31_06910 [candidate division KSB1 bacterium]|nr:hypothetical protein [candidate division KSB1 bacterium]